MMLALRLSAGPVVTGQAELAACPVRLPCGTGDVCGDDVGGVPVEGGAGPVMAHCRAGIGVGGFLQPSGAGQGVRAAATCAVSSELRTKHTFPCGISSSGACSSPRACRRFRTG